jgi:hypothetical protein
VRCPWLQAEAKVATILGKLFLLLLPPLFKTTEGVVVEFRNFAWAPKRSLHKKKPEMVWFPPWFGKRPNYFHLFSREGFPNN